MIMPYGFFYNSTKYIRSLLCTVVLLCCAVGYAGAEGSQEVSGEIITGYRVLDIDPAEVDNSFTVYRGDYIKFRYPESFQSQPFVLEELHYTGTLLPVPEASPFFKMKQAGTYSFQLGEGGGKITVIELVRPNYIELTASEAAELLENIDPFILDVRTPGEYEQLHIKGSYLIPVQELQNRLGELQSQKYQDIFVYCATGNRSTVAAKILADAGFKRIYNLRYGMFDWARNGHPYTTGMEPEE